MHVNRTKEYKYHCYSLSAHCAKDITLHHDILHCDTDVFVVTPLPPPPPPSKHIFLMHCMLLYMYIYMIENTLSSLNYCYFSSFFYLCVGVSVIMLYIYSSVELLYRHPQHSVVSLSELFFTRARLHGMQGTGTN